MSESGEELNRRIRSAHVARHENAINGGGGQALNKEIREKQITMLRELTPDELADVLEDKRAAACIAQEKAEEAYRDGDTDLSHAYLEAAKKLLKPEAPSPMKMALHYALKRRYR